MLKLGKLVFTKLVNRWLCPKRLIYVMTISDLSKFTKGTMIFEYVLSS